jgi:hypothetical protein
MADNSSSDREFDKKVFKYIEALENGDLDGVETAIEQGQADPKLGQVLSEVDLAIAEEEGLLPKTSIGPEVRKWLDGGN